MRNILGLNMGEKKANLDALREALNEDKKNVADELEYYKSVAKDIKKAKKKVEAAERAYEKKSSGKNANKLEDAKDELSAAISVFKESEAQIKTLIDAVQSDYSEIADLYNGKKADRVMDGFEKYSGQVSARMIEIQSFAESDEYLDTDVEDIEPMPMPEIPVSAPAAAPTTAPEQPTSQPSAPAYGAPGYQYPPYIPVMPMPGYYPQQNAEPNIAPVSIDVSPIIEKALEATMEKFVASLDKKIEERLEGRQINVPAGSGATYGSGEIASLEGLILNDEQAIIDKLTDMIENLKTLSAAMNELGTLCADIAVKQSTANEMQKQTNDMQRQTLREQKGIQVGQRVVGQDQAAITVEQASLQEQQKATLETQKTLVDGHKALEETARLVAENQAAIDAAMKSAVAAQKEIITAQQAINAGNAKTLDVQSDVAEKQNATLVLQKEALAAQRQLLRDQKAALEKQKNLGQ